MYRLNLWCAEQLSDHDRDYIAAFPPLIVRVTDTASLLCFHGSPRSFEDVIGTDTAEAELDQMFTSRIATVMAGGHTHIQMIRRYRDGRLINPGSVGLPGVGAGRPYNLNPDWADYAIVDLGDDRTVLTLCRTRIDVRALIARARDAGMPEMEWWTSTWSFSG
jgi:predicted phosphodiesterase